MINISEKNTIILESQYLLISNRAKCKELFNQKDISENQLIDFYISLHIVLEVGINSFFRQIIRMHTAFNSIIGDEIIRKNTDNISFLDKVSMYIHFVNFELSGDLEIAKKHLSIIGKIKDFNFIRNNLLHGHSISQFNLDNSETKKSKTKQLLTVDKMNNQVKLFLEIIEGLIFYFNKHKSGIKESGKESLIECFLDTTFLTQDK
jgi:hypothetical protein